MSQKKAIPTTQLNLFTGYNDFSEIEDEVVNIIVPNPRPLKEEKIKLGAFDATLPPLWMPFTLAFKNELDGKDFMDANKLKLSLSLALGRLPILAGTLVNVDGTKLELLKHKKDMQVKLTNRGAWICIQTTNMNFNQLMEDHLVQDVFPKSLKFKKAGEAILKQDSNSPLLAFKLNYFPCGSVVITAFFCHLIGDGKAMFDFMKLWGAFNRNIEPSATLVDYRNLLSIPDHTPESKQLAETLKKHRIRYSPQIIPLVMCNVTIPLDKLQTLKHYVNKKLLDGQFVSRDDIFSALIWRALVRARDFPPETYTCLKRSVDIRKHLNLPSDAFGNFAMSYATGPLKVSDLLNMPLHNACLTLRQYLTGASNIRTYQTVVLNSPMADIPNLWDNFNPASDLYASTTAHFLMDPIDLDGAPGIPLRPEFILESVLLLIPPVQNVFGGLIGVNPKYANTFAQDKELIANSIHVHCCNIPNNTE